MSKPSKPRGKLRTPYTLTPNQSISGFTLNNIYTFDGSSDPNTMRSWKTWLRKLCKYNVGALLAALISFITFTALYKLAHLYYLVADAIAIVIGTSWNFWVSTRFVWRSAHDEPSEA